MQDQNLRFGQNLMSLLQTRYTHSTPLTFYADFMAYPMKTVMCPVCLHQASLGFVLGLDVIHMCIDSFSFLCCVHKLLVKFV